MTYCLGISIGEGLICLADGRITSGSQISIARKVSLHGPPDRRVCIMTSGLRSLRDKTIAYFDQEYSGKAIIPSGMLEVLDIYVRSLRRVEKEDRNALKASDLSFNLHAIISGQVGKDSKPSMFLLYPEGNWIEVTERSPYISIGSTMYGKPIIDRMLTNDTPLSLALQIAYLSFDSTRVSTNDVDFPLDILTYANDRRWRDMELDYDDVSGMRQWWNDQIKELATNMKEGPWGDCLLPGTGSEHTTTNNIYDLK
jgi:putative proteasome-type protease